MTTKTSLHDHAATRPFVDQVEEFFPWYDAVWLRKYVAAKKVIAQVRPERLSEFTSAFDRLRTRADFTPQKLDRLFDDNILTLVREMIKALPPVTLESHEAQRFGRFVVHDHPLITHLQRTLQSLVSELAGEAVEPSYNFLSLYSKFGICEPHMDAPVAKWTLDLCIDQSEPWPIHFSQIVPWPEDFHFQGDDWQDYVKNSFQLHFKSYSLRPNEAVLFSGSSQWHYRDSLRTTAKDGFCNLAFFHFFPQGMADIVRPRNWPRIFCIPELETMLVNSS